MTDLLYAEGCHDSGILPMAIETNVRYITASCRAEPRTPYDTILAPPGWIGQNASPDTSQWLVLLSGSDKTHAEQPNVPKEAPRKLSSAIQQIRRLYRGGMIYLAAWWDSGKPPLLCEMRRRAIVEGNGFA